VNKSTVIILVDAGPVNPRLEKSTIHHRCHDRGIFIVVIVVIGLGFIIDFIQ
jgi:uncharacterized protein YqhQ